MNEFLSNLVNSAVQCWGCGVFDNLFRVVSNAGAVVYQKVADICFVIFAAMFVFYVIWAVWKHVNPKKHDDSDPFYMKTIVRVVINSLFALTLLGFGVAVPRFITQMTFEPVAQLTWVYTETMLKTTPELVDERVTYVPEPMQDTGFYRPELRNTVINIMKTTVTVFQSFMQLGIAIIEEAFTWSGISSVGDIFRHIIIFAIGAYLFYQFFKLFIRFCFYFVDVIVNMAMFAFLFPFGLMMMSFRGGEMPDWMSSLGNGLGTNQLKKLISAIITLASAVITYMVILAIISRYFSDSGTDTNELMKAILLGEVFESDLSDENLASITLIGAIILVYVLNYIYKQIPNVSKMVLGAFGATDGENKLSEQMANDAEKLVGIVTNSIKSVGNTIINGGEKKDKKKDDGKK